MDKGEAEIRIDGRAWFCYRLVTNPTKPNCDGIVSLASQRTNEESLRVTINQTTLL